MSKTYDVKNIESYFEEDLNQEFNYDLSENNNVLDSTPEVIDNREIREKLNAIFDSIGRPKVEKDYFKDMVESCENICERTIKKVIEA